jgi:hypothetical protein
VVDFPGPSDELNGPVNVASVKPCILGWPRSLHMSL